MAELETAEILRTVLDSLRTGVYLVDRERKIRFWNRGAESVTGYQRHDVVGHMSRENILFGCNDVGCMLCGAACPLTEVIHDGKAKEVQAYLHHKSGQRIPVHMHLFPVRDVHGAITCTAVSFDEDRSGAELDLHQNNLAAHGCLDTVTGTPNHAFTQSYLRENLAFFNEYHLPFGILCIEVEQLAELQASHGRESVDVMLHVVAQTMKHSLRPDGVLGRWTDTRFLGLVTHCNEAELERLAQNLQKMASSSGIQWWDDLLSVNVSVGKAMVRSGDTVETLLERALQSLEGKHPGKAVAAAAGQSGAKN